jgi:hypothetical protein
MTSEEYCNLIEELKVAAASEKKTPRHYYILSRYEILKCDDVERLIRKRGTNEDDSIVYFCHTSEMFDILRRIHIQTGNTPLVYKQCLYCL